MCNWVHVTCFSPVHEEVCIHTIIDTHISPIFFEAVGPCMLRQSLQIILLMYSAGSKSTSSHLVCVFMCITLLLTWTDRECLNTNAGLWVGTHSVHVNAVSVGPGMLEILLQPLAKRVGNLVEADKLSDPQHLGVVPGRSRVQTLDDGRNIPKDAGIHQC